MRHEPTAPKKARPEENSSSDSLETAKESMKDRGDYCLQSYPCLACLDENKVTTALSYKLSKTSYDNNKVQASFNELSKKFKALQLFI